MTRLIDWENTNDENANFEARDVQNHPSCETLQSLRGEHNNYYMYHMMKNTTSSSSCAAAASI